MRKNISSQQKNAAVRRLLRLQALTYCVRPTQCSHSFLDTTFYEFCITDAKHFVDSNQRCLQIATAFQ